MLVEDGAQIASGTFGEGKGGNIAIDVSEMELIGTYSGGIASSGVFSSSIGTGDAGDLSFKGENLLIKSGAKISAATRNAGNAGNIDLNADSIIVTGRASEGDRVSTIAASSRTTFPAGDINITTNKLDVTNDGEISVNNTDSGDAGNLIITANQINLNNGGGLNAEVNEGQQGNINLITDNIFLNNDSQITTKASNNSTGGNISIDNSENLVLTNNSQIIAEAEKGNGGNINITTQGYFVDLSSDISASSEFGLDGDVEVETIQSDRTIELDSLPNKPINAAEQITSGCSFDSDFAIAGKGGLPDNPIQHIRNETTWQDLRIPAIDNPQVTERSWLFFKPNSAREAQNWKINSQGKVELVAQKSSLWLRDRFNCSKISDRS